MPLPAGYALDTQPTLPPGYKLDTPTVDKSKGLLTGNPVGDALAGAGAGAAHSLLSIYDGLRLLSGRPHNLPDSEPARKAISEMTPDTASAHVGRFLEQAAEFMIPAGRVAKVQKGLSLAARVAGQAGAGGIVAAVQSGGDPIATAVGAGMGGGGEIAGAALGGARALFSEKAPTLANWAESFGNATPTQKARLTRAIDTLTKDGLKPPDSVHETQELIKGKLDDLGKAYQALDPAVKLREVDPADVIQHLTDLQKQYMRRGVVTDTAAYNTIADQIQAVKNIASGPPAVVGGNAGKLTVDDIVHLKQGANGKTAFNSPDADKSLWRGIGDAYRSAADTLAPETTPLNRDYAKYKDLEQIIDQNIARGKGTTPSGLTALLTKATQHGTGAAAGAALGGAAAGPVGAALGGVAGGFIGPKVGKVAAQAIQNAIDSGAFAKLSPVKQGIIRAMSSMGDNAGILKALGQEAAIQ